jgi:uncharacterized protein YprB with RNaseH-like and TPR domain/predicted nuclease with RNAse H fold/dephospho-CoA kinase
MLNHTFLHLPGIGSISERRIWKSGVRTWDEYERTQSEQLPLFPGGRRPDVEALARSREALQHGDIGYFSERLPPAEQYRIALSFPRETIFVDIESTGLSLYYDYITVVGWERNGRFGAWIRGSDNEEMYRAFSEAKVIVTFNGSRFDLPFLRKEFPDLPIPLCHIDLRFFVRRAGVSGGQKAVEERLGIVRELALKGIAGEAAPVLWHRYRWGDPQSLKLLVAYNHADIDGLKMLMDIAIAESIRVSSSPTNVADITKFSAARTQPRFTRTKGKPGIFISRYQGATTPPVTWRDLELPDDFCAVGIDLTGSEERPSGWSSIRGGEATTARIGSDDELVDATIGSGATLVSIDSPLSLPIGRLNVEDTDPGRDQYGIMRQCERTLRQRGINVYPCLLPSMQKLTARGIKLAARFRALGIPVIESYPGAAQDIMGIPRKRASLELLAKGLGAFGLTGPFTGAVVSHDELDAITSAIVGLFFWGGRFEALGNEDEDYLIIPEIASGERRWQVEIAIGVSGPINAGKTTAGEVMRRLGMHYARYSQVIDKIAAERGLESTREVRQIIGLEIHRHGGQRALGRHLLGMLAGARRIVIDGMRHPEDHAFLIESFGPAFRHLTITANRDVRVNRAISSGVDPRVFEASLDHAVEANVAMLAQLADRALPNEGSIEVFQRAVETTVRGLMDDQADAH